MALLVLALILILVLGGAMWVTFGLVSLLLTLFVAGLVGWAADAIIPGQLAGGWLGAILAGILGGFIGGLIMGNVGPLLFGVHIVPAFVGALLVVGVAELVTGSRSNRMLR